MKSTFCRALVFLAVLVFALGATPAGAVDFHWTGFGFSDDWNAPENWTPAGPPSGGGGNFAYVNSGDPAEISADIPLIQDIFVGNGGGSSGTLNQTGGDAFVTGWSFVGRDGGTGVYNLSGGTTNPQRLYVGFGANGNGTLNLSGSGVVVGGELFIAGFEGGSAVVNASGGGSLNTTGNVEFHRAQVSITDNAQVKSANEVWFGNGGGNSTTADMDSGTVEADTWIAIGRDSATGVVNLSGTATMRKLNVGTDNSDGSFIVIGGLGAGGNGTLNISEDAVVHSGTGMLLNETAGQAGVVNQSGGTVTLNDFTPQAFQPTYGQSLSIDPNGHGQGQYHLSGGTLSTQTVLLGSGVFDMTGGVFSATNFMGNLTQNGGTTSPGASPGTMTVTGNYSLDSGDLLIELDGLTAGTEYDQLIVTGDVSLTGDLTLDVGFSPSLSNMFTIIENQGSNPVSGMFSQGSSISAGGFLFGINYGGGDGNDVVLTLVPEPNTAPLSLVMAGLIGMAAQRRRMA